MRRRARHGRRAREKESFMRHQLVLASMMIGLLAGCAVAPADEDVGAAAAAVTSIGEGEVFSAFGAPGFPEGVAVHHNRVYVSGPANFDMTSTALRVYHQQTGELLETIQVTHSDGDPADALSCVTVDGDGRLYVLSEALGVVRLTKHGNQWEQEVYAPLPADGLPGCRHGYQLVPDFSDPLFRPACHLLNDLAFDASGKLYVTDSMRATIYTVAPGGGALQTWFESSYLVGGPPFPIGVNGIRLSPAGDEVYFTVSTSPLPELAGRGALYKLPAVAAPAPGDLTAVHYFDAGLGPDGFAFGASGEVYTTLAFSNQLSIVDPASGDEVSRLSGPAGSEVPYDAPANVAFDGHGSVFVTNHALLSGQTANMGVLRVFVDDGGAKLFAPKHLD
jgi:sugar lactone lactonase YvrE